MQSNFQVLIIGGGNAGIAVAAQLLRLRPNLSIALIEPSETHYYQPAFTLVGAGVFNPKDTQRSEALQIPRGVKWIKEHAEEFIPESHTVKTSEGSVYIYDVLVVAPGIQLDWSAVKGLKEAVGKNGVSSNYQLKTAEYTWELFKSFKGGNALFTNPNTPIKCGGAPQKVMYLFSDYIRKNPVSKDSQVHFYSGGGVIFGVPKYRETLEGVLKNYKIQTHYKHNLVEIKADEKVAVFEYDTEEGKKQLEKSYDIIHVTPPQSAPDFIKRSPLAQKNNPLGWVDVNPNTLQHSVYPAIFSLGDVTNTPNAKTGAAIRKQAPVVVKNILSYLDKKDLTAFYDGYGSCPLTTGYGKLVLAEFNYKNEPLMTFPFDQSEERYSMWLLKKHVLPWLYWNKILKGSM